VVEITRFDSASGCARAEAAQRARTPPVGISGYTELFLDRLESRADAAERPQWTASVELGLKMMEGVSQMQAVCRPRRMSLAARWDRMRGRSGAARKKLKKAGELARLVHGAWDERLVAEELGRLG